MEKAFNCAIRKKRLPPPLQASSLGHATRIGMAILVLPTNQDLPDILPMSYGRPRIPDNRTDRARFLIVNRLRSQD